MATVIGDAFVRVRPLASGFAAETAAEIDAGNGLSGIFTGHSGRQVEADARRKGRVVGQTLANAATNSVGGYNLFPSTVARDAERKGKTISEAYLSGAERSKINQNLANLYSLPGASSSIAEHDAEVAARRNGGGFLRRLLGGGTADAARAGARTGESLLGGLTSSLSGGMSKITSLLSLGLTDNPIIGAVTAVGAALGGIGYFALKSSAEMQTAFTQIANSEDIPIRTARRIADAFSHMTSEFSGQDLAASFAQIAGQLAQVQGHPLTIAQSARVMGVAQRLAEASGQDLGTTTQALGEIMSTFKVNTKGAAGAADILFNSASATGVSMTLLARQFAQMHSRLGTMGGTFAQYAGLLLDITHHGYSGRSAMLALSSSLNTLLRPTVKNAETQRAITTALAGMTPATRALVKEQQALTSGTTSSARAQQALVTVGRNLSPQAKMLASAYASGNMHLGVYNRLLGQLSPAQRASALQYSTLVRQINQLDAANQGTAMRTKAITAAMKNLSPQQAFLAKEYLSSVEAMRKAQFAQREYGVTVENSKGQFVGWASILDQLGPKFRRMTQMQQYAEATQLFGTSAAHMFMDVVASGPGLYSKYTRSVAKHGSVALAASRQEHTLAGEWATMRAGFSNWMTELGSKLQPFMQKATKWVAEWLGKLIKYWPEITAAFAKFFHYIAPIWSTITAEVRTTWDMLADLLDFIAAVFTGKWGKAWKDVQKIFVLGEKFVETAVKNTGKMLEKIFRSVGPTIGHALDSVWHDFLRGGKELPGILQHTVLPKVGEFFKNLPTYVADLLHDFFTIAFKVLGTVGDWLMTTVLPAVLSFFEGLPGEIFNVLGTLLTTGFAVLGTVGDWLVTTVLPKFLTFFAGLPARIGSLLGDLVGIAFATLLHIDTWLLTHVLPKVVSFFASLPGRIGKALVNLLSDAFKGLTAAGSWFGHHVIDPILNFFRHLPSQAASIIRSGARTVLNSFTSWIPGTGGGLGNLLLGGGAVNLKAGSLAAKLAADFARAHHGRDPNAAMLLQWDKILKEYMKIHGTKKLPSIQTAEQLLGSVDAGRFLRGRSTPPVHITTNVTVHATSHAHGAALAREVEIAMREHDENLVRLLEQRGRRP